MAGDVIHNLLSHGIVKYLVEKSAWLLVVGVWMGVLVSANWTHRRLSVDSVGCTSLLWTTECGWLVVWCLAITASDVHDTVTLVVGRTHSCSEWTVDWDLVVVGSESMSVSIRVVDESSLKHLAV